eukprot:TRINITY_DN6712_c0_g1_i2.p2 TRINITY_DN6712_c0_g1~~TRINITY_DN6712_c0_g1_i2.p2  ORF type:complete len:149 (-),score=10.37 TRINITY_DN6712_c0_g1_i2:44-490(-)
MFLFQLILTLPVTIGIISLLFYQISCIYYNCTSIENHMCEKVIRNARRSGVKNFSWIHDFGVMYNFKQVLGDSVLGWFIPNIPDHVLQGDGISYKTKLYKINVPEPVDDEDSEDNKVVDVSNLSEDVDQRFKVVPELLKKDQKNEKYL